MSNNSNTDIENSVQQLRCHTYDKLPDKVNGSCNKFNHIVCFTNIDMTCIVICDIYVIPDTNILLHFTRFRAF